MSDRQVGQLGPLTGHADDVTVTLTGLSFGDTRDGRRYAYGDFGSDFIEALHKQLVTPRRRGVLRSSLACPRCDVSLDGTASDRVAVTAEVLLPRIPPIRVDLDLPGITCPNCRAVVVRTDDRAVESNLSDALIAIFTEAGIKPA